jgi:2-phosphosulfolactate phosphatase
MSPEPTISACFDNRDEPSDFTRHKRMFYDQTHFDIRCEWGEHGVKALAPVSDLAIIFDVLSFTTCVDVGVSRGAILFPYRFRDETAAEFAKSKDAILAGHREDGGLSLSPASLVNATKGMRIVLPSPNGATLTFAAGKTPVMVGCLRNCRAIAQAVKATGAKSIALIPSGERWPDDNSLRPAIEDLIGAGAMISMLNSNRTRSPEARIAVAAFERARKEGLLKVLQESSSGRELIERGYPRDVEMAAEFDVSSTVPVLRDGAFVAG